MRATQYSAVNDLRLHVVSTSMYCLRILSPIFHRDSEADALEFYRERPRYC